MAGREIGNLPIIDNSSTEIVGPVLDSQTTSLENVLRLLIKDKYTKDTLSGVTGFQGVVLRAITDPRLLEYSNRTEARSTTNVVPIRYKVWVLGPIFSIFRQPKDFNDYLAMEGLPDFSPSRELANRQLAAGELVWVTFGNNNNFKDPTIEYSFSDGPTATVSQGATPAGVTSPSDNFPVASPNGPTPPTVAPPIGSVAPTLQVFPSNGQWVLSPVQKAELCVGNVDTYNKIINQFGLKTSITDSNPRYTPKDLPVYQTETVIEKGKKVTKYVKDSSGKLIQIGTRRQTYCNIFVYDVCCAYGAKYPYWTNSPNIEDGEPIFYQGFSGNNNGGTKTQFGQPGNIQLSSVYGNGAWEKNANYNFAWMNKNASKYGWKEISGEEAQAAANRGFLTIGILRGKPRENNGGALGAGHVWIIRPTADGKIDNGRLHIAEAGANCRNSYWYKVNPAHAYYTVDCPNNK